MDRACWDSHDIDVKNVSKLESVCRFSKILVTYDYEWINYISYIVFTFSHYITQGLVLLRNSQQAFRDIHILEIYINQ